MSLRLQRICLRIATAVVLCLAGAELWQVLQADPGELDRRQSIQRPTVAEQAQTSAVNAPDDQELSFDDIGNLPLQRPLFDPPPPPPKVEVKPPPPPIRAQLLGTVINPTRPQAIIRDEQGSVTFRTLGDSVSDAHPEAIIEEILASSIRLRRGEATETMVIQ